MRFAFRSSLLGLALIIAVPTASVRAQGAFETRLGRAEDCDAAIGQRMGDLIAIATGYFCQYIAGIAGIRAQVVQLAEHAIETQSFQPHAVGDCIEQLRDLFAYLQSQR